MAEKIYNKYHVGIAHIHNETLKTAFNQYQGKLVDINGKIRYRQQNDDYDEAKWLQYNII